MKTKFIWLIMSCLMVVALVLASCAPAVVEKKEATVVTKEPEKKVEKVDEVVKKVGPQYGGVLTDFWWKRAFTFDLADAHLGTYPLMSYTHNSLIKSDWYIDRDIADYTDANDTRNREELWVGDLAESWERPDNLTIIFHLREGVRWQNLPPVNGREFVADDVVWHIQRIKAAPKWANQATLQKIESITAPDKYTVVVKFSEIFVNQLQVVGMETYEVGAREIEEQYGDLKDWKTVVGTGPFILEDFVPDVSLTYIRNPDYFEKDPEGRSLPYLDGIKRLFIEDTATRLAALRTGKIDIIQPGAPLSWEQRPSLEASNPELQWKEIPKKGKVFWLKTIIEPFDDVRVRQALAMATNRDEILNSVYGGTGTAYAWPGSPSWKDIFIPLDELPEDIRSCYEWKPENIGKAKALLAEAGYPNGFKTSVQYQQTGGEWEAMGDIVELVKAQWDEIGVDLELKPVDYATRISLKTSPFPYEQILADGYIQYPINGIYNRFRTGGHWNTIFVSDPYIDKAIDKAVVTLDWTECQKMLKDIYLYVVEQCYGIAFPSFSAYSVWQPWLKGYQGESCITRTSSMGAVYAHLWLDQDLKEEVTGRR